MLLKISNECSARLWGNGPTHALWKVMLCCLTLCDTMDCSLPGSGVHGILQARILEWVAMPSSRGSSQSRGRTQVSSVVGRSFTSWATRETRGKEYITANYIKSNLANVSKSKETCILWPGISTFRDYIWK